MCTNKLAERTNNFLLYIFLFNILSLRRFAVLRFLKVGQVSNSCNEFQFNGYKPEAEWIVRRTSAILLFEYAIGTFRSEKFSPLGGLLVFNKFEQSLCLAASRSIYPERLRPSALEKVSSDVGRTGGIAMAVRGIIEGGNSPITIWSLSQELASRRTRPGPYHFNCHIYQTFWDTRMARILATVRAPRARYQVNPRNLLSSKVSENLISWPNRIYITDSFRVSRTETIRIDAWCKQCYANLATFFLLWLSLYINFQPSDFSLLSSAQSQWDFS